MGKVLIAVFDDEEEIDFNELIFFLKKKSHVVLMNDFSGNGILNYGTFTIDSKYRTVKIDDTNIELTNYEFEILYLMARSP